MTTTLTNARMGGHLLVDQLRLHGVEQVFCVPGESYLAVLDGLYDSDIDVTVCRQEGGAAMMAEAYGKLQGKPGICMVTRGPGVANAMAGIHIAQQDSTPLIVFVGQVAREMQDREAFQELDYKAVFGSQTKWTCEIQQVDRIPELIARAFHVASSGRPGPVVISLPEDMLCEYSQAKDARPYTITDTAASVEQVQSLHERVLAAKQPIAILGGTRWTSDAVAQFESYAAAMSLPVCAQFRRQTLFSNNHACYVGDLGLGANPDLLAYIRSSDLVILLGGRGSEVPSQSYTLFDIPHGAQELVHVHPDVHELNKVYQANLAINASPSAFIAALAPLASGFSRPSSESLKALRSSYQQWNQPASIRTPGALQMGPIMDYLRKELPDDAILCNGAGNYASWLHRFYNFRRFGTQLAPTSGSMGYGVPAAVSAKRQYPDRTVIALAGDGCFLMHGQEFATAVQYGLNIVVIVIDNQMYGTIRMHQERDYPARPSATMLKNPDFAAYAQAFGGHGERVDTTEQFAPAFERAMKSGKPAIIHCLLDPQAITPTLSLDAIRDQALKQNNSH